MNILKTGLVAFGLVIGITAMAQEKEGAKTPQERAQFMTDRMSKELSLTEAQKTKVAGLNLETAEKNAAIRKDASMTAEQKKEASQANRKSQKEQLKTILTAEQLAVLKAKKEAAHAKHKEGIAKHSGKKGKTPQDRARFKTDWMMKELSLTDAQQSKVSELNLTAAEKKTAIRKDVSLNEAQKKEAFKAAHLEQKASLTEILTPEQMTLLKTKKKECHAKHAPRK